MNKKISLKLILTIFITELIILVGTFGIIKYNLDRIEKQIDTNQITINDVQLAVKTVDKDLIYVVAICSVIIIFVMIMLSKYLSKMVIYPKKKMIEHTSKTSEDTEIRTILHHMTDGIIAFNIDGKIAIINPAAKKLLDIAPEDYTFEDIFNKFKLNINMEKIIYLENLT